MKTKTATYLTIYEKIKLDIIKGVYPYKSKLPSKRVLASDLNVSVITIEHAYSLLYEEGYIDSKERSGYYVIFSKGDGFNVKPEYFPQPTLKEISLQEQTCLFPFSVISKTIRKILTDYGATLYEKSENTGCTQFKNAIKGYLAKSKEIYVDTNQIIVGSGAEYLYGLIIELLGRNNIFGIEKPSYKQIEQVYKANEVKYELLPLTHDGIDSFYLSNTNATILHTTPFRSFPTGVTATASKRHEYLDWASKNDRYIIEDDYESEFYVFNKPHESLFSSCKTENVIYLNTFTKTIAPSIRVAYMVIPKKLVEKFNQKLSFYSCTVPTLEQYLITELLNNGDFERHINRVRRLKRKKLIK